MQNVVDPVFILCVSWPLSYRQVNALRKADDANHVGYLIVTDGEEVYVFTNDEAYQDWQQVNKC